MVINRHGRGPRGHLAYVVRWQSKSKTPTHQRAARQVLSYELVLNTNTHTAVV